MRIVEKVVPKPPGAESVDNRDAGKLHINRMLLPESQAVFPATCVNILAKEWFVPFPHKAGRMIQRRNPACVNLERLHDLLVEALVIKDARRTVDIWERKKRLQNYLPAVKEKATNTAVRRLQFIRMLLVSQQESFDFPYSSQAPPWQANSRLPIVASIFSHLGSSSKSISGMAAFIAL